ncbi:four helix bundle protein [candidate division KSB1 bacterium]
MTERFLKLNDISAYKLAFNLSNSVWNTVINWNHFERNTVEQQFVRAVDSISANIAEGFGRYTKKDKIRFYRISIGSIKESMDWNEKSKIRNLISDNDYNNFLEILQKLPKEINQLIKFTNEKLSI